MAGNRFDNTLHILHPTKEDLKQKPELELSVCAMGDVADGEQLTWMRVWIFQRVDKRVSASSGTGGVHLGGHKKVASEDFPVKGRWMVQTELEPDTDQFSPGPALAVALARVIQIKADGANPEDVDFWNQPVVIADHEHAEHEHGEHEHGEHEHGEHEHPHG
jgi:hypothetical protein